MPRRLIQTLKTSAGTAALVSALVLVAPADADSLKREGLPAIEGVTLISVEDGELKYRTAAGDRSAPLKEITDLTIDNVPAFATGLKAFKADQMRAAQRSFESIWADNRVDWVRHYAGFYLAQVYDQRNEPVSAGQVYAKLASDGADLFFLSKPPTASLAEADDDQKERITAEILAVAEGAKGERRKKLEAYLRMVAGEEAALPQDADAVADNRRALQRRDSAVIIPEDVWKVPEKRNQPAGKWESLDLLAAGKFREAIDKVNEWQDNPGELPAMLYIKARAQLALADEDNDEKLYRDAGLTFMRIVVHYNKAGGAHPLVAPARLEVAYIHKQIGREDIYQRLLFGGDAGGGVHLVIDDPKTYPQYRLRYYQIIGEDPPETEPAE